MKVIIFGKDGKEIEAAVRSCGFTVLENGAGEKPDLVFSYGGDGTLMHAEHVYPGVPKVPLRNSRICKSCFALPNEAVLEKIKQGRYHIIPQTKLVVEAHGEQLTAINDIIVHNYDPRHAIRYHFAINNSQVGNEIIGDGFVVATPFGAGGYYRSITDSIFEVGIGVAFNNSTEPSDHLVIADSSVIMASITRGPAIVFADNQEGSLKLDVGDQVKIMKSPLSAQVVKLD